MSEEKKPHCPVCGSPCPECMKKVDDYTLTIIDENIRGLVLEVLEDIGRTQDKQDALVKGLIPYANSHIIRAYNIWKAGNYKSKGIGSPQYFVKMVQQCAVSGRVRLEALPPLKE